MVLVFPAKEVVEEVVAEDMDLEADVQEDLVHPMEGLIIVVVVVLVVTINVAIILTANFITQDAMEIVMSKHVEAIFENDRN